jgi:hypothetical protein
VWGNLSLLAHAAKVHRQVTGNKSCHSSTWIDSGNTCLLVSLKYLPAACWYVCVALAILSKAIPYLTGQIDD